MSTDTPLTKDVAPHANLPSLARQLGTAVTRPVTAAAFWLAVVLPFLHVPLLATGLRTSQTTTAFAALVGLNVVALVVGHRHHGSADPE